MGMVPTEKHLQSGVFTKGALQSTLTESTNRLTASLFSRTTAIILLLAFMAMPSSATNYPPTADSLTCSEVKMVYRIADLIDFYTALISSQEEDKRELDEQKLQARLGPEKGKTRYLDCIRNYNRRIARYNTR